MLLDGRPELFFDGYRPYLKIVIHNLTKKVIEPQNFNFALIVPDIIQLDCKNIFSVIDLPDKRRFYNMKIKDALFPDGWQSLTANFSIIGDGSLKNLLLEMILCVLTEVGSHDYPFTLKLNNVFTTPAGGFKLDLREDTIKNTTRKAARKK